MDEFTYTEPELMLYQTMLTVEEDYEGHPEKHSVCLNMDVVAQRVIVGQGTITMSVQGKENLEALVYAIAVRGGLVEEGEELRLNG